MAWLYHSIFRKSGKEQHAPVKIISEVHRWFTAMAACWWRHLPMSDIMWSSREKNWKQYSRSFGRGICLPDSPNWRYRQNYDVNKWQVWIREAFLGRISASPQATDGWHCWQNIPNLWNHQQCCWFLYVETCNFGETNPQYRAPKIACQVTHVLMT